MLVFARVRIDGSSGHGWPTVFRPIFSTIPVCVVGSETGPVLVRPRMLTQENISIFEALEEDLEAAWLWRERPVLPVELAAVPEGVVKRLGGKPNDVCVWNEVGPELPIEDICSRFAHIGEVRN